MTHATLHCWHCDRIRHEQRAWCDACGEVTASYELDAEPEPVSYLDVLADIQHVEAIRRG